jgi:hypothetical protein
MLSDMKSVPRKLESLKERLARRIARKRGDVFLRADFSDLGGYDQVGRALRGLVHEGRLLKIGYGIYARARPSTLDGKPMPTKDMGELAREALGRLGIETAPTRLEEAYYAGRIPQVPTGRVIGVRGRVRRQIFYNGFPFGYEQVGRKDDGSRPGARGTRKHGRAATERDLAAAGPEIRTPVTMREALCGIWLADKYPVLGNEDVRVALRMSAEALEKAATAMALPDDPPEFGQWIAALCDPQTPGDGRDEIILALHDLFDPE